MKRKLFTVLGLFCLCLFFSGCSCKRKTTTNPTTKHTHTLVKHEAVSKTCTENGNIEYYTCDDCDKKFSDSLGETEITDIVTTATGHTYSAYTITTAPTETVTGSATRKCSTCNHEDTLTLPVLNETNYTLTNVNSTCVEKGSKKYTLKSNTSIVITNAQDALGHNLTHHDKVDATCTTSGNVEYWSCDRCNKNYSDSLGTTEITTSVVLNATGHSFGGGYTITLKPTALATGTAIRKCRDCSEIDTLILPVLSATDYDYELVPAPTCLYTGSETYTLKNTSIVVINDLDALGHNMTHYDRVEATCTTNGNIEYYSCDRCDLNFSNSDGTIWLPGSVVLDATGHEYGDVVCIGNGTHTQSCVVCGKNFAENCTVENGLCTLCQVNATRGLSYSFNNNCYSVDEIETVATTDIVIPSYYYGPNGWYPVTAICNNAFAYCTSITSITIPNSVTSIGDYAFAYCTSITSITIPNSVTSIGDYAFYNCISITSITIPNSVTSIEDYAFYNCIMLATIYINSSTIANMVVDADYSCGCLVKFATTVYIEKSITTIGLYIKDKYTKEISPVDINGVSYYKYSENA